MAYYIPAVVFLEKYYCREGVLVKILAVIPARYGSSRFEGKVLAKRTGKFLIQHTYQQACKAKLIEKVLIATDDQKVLTACTSFGADCVMTSDSHQSGTDRIAEAVADIDAEIIINVQADEPEIDPENIDYLAQLMLENSNCQMATLVAEFKNKDDIADANIVKVVVDNKGYARYFSRSPIPYDRAAAGIGNAEDYLQHLGIYAYRRDFLAEITSLPQTRLEKIEKLEQLRPIEYGYSILTGRVKTTCHGIDTPQQYQEFVKRILNKK